jgi:hypothetical protein
MGFETNGAKFNVWKTEAYDVLKTKLEIKKTVAEF